MLFDKWKCMTYHKIHSKQKIKEVIDFLLTSENVITVRIEGDATTFASRILKVDYGRAISPVAKKPLITIKHLTPERGNRLLGSDGHSAVLFKQGDTSYEFDAQHVGWGSPPLFGHVIAFPDFIRCRERRKYTRYSDRLPQFVRAELRLGRGRDEERIYELDVLDYSAIGVGVVVTGDSGDLIEAMKIGARIRGITIYTEWSLIHVNGTVIHKGRVQEGGHKGAQVLGIRFDEILPEL
jgi:hypothetical protein